MEIKNVITIDNLTADSVSVKTQRVLLENSVEYAVGNPVRTSYINNTQSREELINNVPEPYCSAIIDVWGENTVSEEQNITE